MPPKFDPKSPENVALIEQFTNLGLSSNAATELVKQPKTGQAFKGLVDGFQLADKKFDEKQAAALVKLSTAGAKLGPAEKGYAVERIVGGGLKSPDQVTGASSQCNYWSLTLTFSCRQVPGEQSSRYTSR